MSIPQDRPAYRILATHGFFGPDDNLYNEGECIVFDDEPNEEMEPLNELAVTRMQLYLEKLDNLARLKAEKDGRPFIARARDLDGAIAIARAAEMDKVVVMSAQKDIKSIGKVEAEPISEVGKKRGRPPGKSKLSIAA